MKTLHLVLGSTLAVGLLAGAAATAGIQTQTPSTPQATQAKKSNQGAPAPQQRGPMKLAPRAGGAAGMRGGDTPFAGMGNGSSPFPGTVAVLDGVTFAGTTLPTTPSTGLNGLTFTLDGRMWGSTGGIGSGSSRIVEIDKASGASLGFQVLDGGGAITITDLATHPTTGVIYGFGAGTGILYSINQATGVANPIGANGMSNWGGLAFAQDGTLYHCSSTVANPLFLTLDVNTGQALTTLTYGPATGCCGLTVRPSDGTILATQGTFAGGDNIVSIDPITGTTTSVGFTGVGTPSDLAYDAGKCQLDLGSGGPGTSTLQICGEDLLTAGNSATLKIDTPLPTTLAVLVVGPGFNPTPFLGGTLVPSGAPLVFTNYITDLNGDVSFAIAASGTNPVVLYAQVGALDLTQPQLVQFTNALQVTIVL